MSTEEENQGHGLTPQKMGTGERKDLFSFHFERYYSGLPA
jgi:hypothetical protein